MTYFGLVATVIVVKGTYPKVQLLTMELLTLPKLIDQSPPSVNWNSNFSLKRTSKRMSSKINRYAG